MRVEFIVKRPGSPEIFVTGFHGIGVVGYLAVRHLSESCQRAGYVRVLPEAPYVSAGAGQSLITPGDIYLCDKIMAVVMNFGVADAVLNRYTRDLARWVVDNGLKTAVLFGGLDSRLRTDPEDRLRVIYTKRYGEIGLPMGNSKMLEPGLHIVGPLALLLSEFERLDFPAMVVLPYADVSRPDPSAASTALEFFSSLFGIHIDTSKLRELAVTIEKELEEVRKMEDKARGATHLYI